MGMFKQWSVECENCDYERTPVTTYKDVLIMKLKEEGWGVKRVNNQYRTLCPSCKNKSKQNREVKR